MMTLTRMSAAIATGLLAAAATSAPTDSPAGESAPQGRPLALVALASAGAAVGTAAAPNNHDVPVALHAQLFTASAALGSLTPDIPHPLLRNGFHVRVADSDTAHLFRPTVMSVTPRGHGDGGIMPAAAAMAATPVADASVALPRRPAATAATAATATPSVRRVARAARVATPQRRRAPATVATAVMPGTAASGPATDRVASVAPERAAARPTVTTG